MPYELRDLLRHAYPSGDYGDTSAHAALMASARMDQLVDQVLKGLCRGYDFAALIAPPSEGRPYYEMPVSRYLTRPSHAPPRDLPSVSEIARQMAQAASEPKKDRPHLEYVLLGDLVISAFGPYAFYRRQAAVGSQHPPSESELADAETKVRDVLERVGIEVPPSAVLNASVDGMRNARLDGRPVVPTVHVCLFRRGH